MGEVRCLAFVIDSSPLRTVLSKMSRPPLPPFLRCRCVIRYRTTFRGAPTTCLGRKKKDLSGFSLQAEDRHKYFGMKRRVECLAESGALFWMEGIVFFSF